MRELRSYGSVGGLGGNTQADPEPRGWGISRGCFRRIDSESM